MNSEQYLLICLMEECAEVQQACAKALRFGMENHHPDRTMTNRQELEMELQHLRVIEGELDVYPDSSTFKYIGEKKKNLYKYAAISRKEGILESGD